MTQFLAVRDPNLSAEQRAQLSRMAAATSAQERRRILEENDENLAAALLNGAPASFDRGAAIALLAEHASALPLSTVMEPKDNLEEIWPRLADAAELNQTVNAYSRSLLGATIGIEARTPAPPFAGADFTSGLRDTYGLSRGPGARADPWRQATLGSSGFFPAFELRQRVEGYYFPGILLPPPPRPFRERFAEEGGRFGAALSVAAEHLGTALPILERLGVQSRDVANLRRAQNVLSAGSDAFTKMAAFAAATTFEFGTFFPMVGAAGALADALFGDGGLFGSGEGGGNASGPDPMAGSMMVIMEALAEVLKQLDEIRSEIREIRVEIRALSREIADLRNEINRRFDQIFGQLAFLRRDLLEIRDLALAEADRDIGLCDFALGLIDQGERRLSVAMASPGISADALRRLDPYRRLFSSSSTTPLPRCFAGLLDAFGRDPLDGRNRIHLRRYSARIVADDSPAPGSPNDRQDCVDRLRNAANNRDRVVAERRGQRGGSQTIVSATARTAAAFSNDLAATAESFYECAWKLARTLAPFGASEAAGGGANDWRPWQRAARPRGDAFAYLPGQSSSVPLNLTAFDRSVFVHRASYERWASEAVAIGDLSVGLGRLLDGSKLIRHATMLRRLAGVMDLEEVVAERQSPANATEGVARDLLAHAESLLTVATMQRSMLAGEAWLDPLNALIEGRSSGLPEGIRGDEAHKASLRAEAFVLLASDAGADLARNLAMFTIVRRLSAKSVTEAMLDPARLANYGTGFFVSSLNGSPIHAALDREGESRVPIEWISGHNWECLGFPDELGHRSTGAQSGWAIVWRRPDGIGELSADGRALPARVCVVLPSTEQVSAALFSYPPQTEEIGRLRDEITSDLLTRGIAERLAGGTPAERHVHALVSYMWMHAPSR
ncbi:hypothetical protein [Roseomonas fluvialis]|uniref:hypothetical protein n=1 Tax=Roseomonas fluvialis TaxID=1750527 RepID=UPI001FCCA6E5|nr:hypothetical protein [Roseomonas fluvialis]